MQQEVRVALVLYGGVSLAVYMSGVTQEFFHLVRATSVGDQEPRTEVESVYRELGSLTASRFVVDIASGSSAGGMNAIFLGKALASGQSLDGLNRFWLDQADVECLWNRAWLPRSILSGQRLYEIVSDGLSSMDTAEAGQRLQAEMDVFITATDLEGLELPLPLLGAIGEKRHKNLFHFRFGDSTSDFSRDTNAMLAFAARATSAFPFAFEPARLTDYVSTAEAGRFFPDYVAAGVDYASRAFADGGCLNNKPFHHALKEIPYRAGDLPVRRMLFYVEPSPERAGRNAIAAGPGPLRNSLEAVVLLQQYETIREDLEHVVERNCMVGRVREAIAQVDRDVEGWQRGARSSRVSGEVYAQRTLADEIHDRGPGYAGYHRLKIRAVTGELSRRLGRDARPWREEAYSEDNAASSDSAFLLHFDLGYRQRRLRFLMTKLDEQGSDPALRIELARIAEDLARLDRTQFKGSDMEVVRKAFAEALIPASEKLDRLFEGHPLKRYLDHYEDYDQVTFPILYETQIGEAEPVEVFRLSPLDARSLIDETDPGERRRKLAGTMLCHFGAFLKREWRVNDMLWGRLDGAERIVTSILPPDSPDAERLVREAQLAILRDHFGDQAALIHAGFKVAHQVDRRIGFATVARIVARLTWIGLKMALAAAYEKCRLCLN